MEARSQSVAHPNENEFHFQLECLLIEDDAANPLAVPMTSSQHVYEVRPRSDERGCDLTSDALPFGRLWYRGPKAIRDAIGYAKFFSRSHDAVIRVYDDAGKVIGAHEQAGDFKQW